MSEKEPNYEAEWNAFESLLMALRGKINEHIAPPPKPLTDWYFERLDEHEKKVNEAFPDPEERSKYLAYHVSIYSSTRIEKSPKMDFPGDLSYEQFYKDTLAEIERKLGVPQE